MKNVDVATERKTTMAKTNEKSTKKDLKVEITDAERIIADKLRKKIEEIVDEKLSKTAEVKKNKFSYLNCNPNKRNSKKDPKYCYAGWVSAFHIKLPNGESMKLDLSQKKDLFLLFVLAVAWSRLGQWENAACFVTYLRYMSKNEGKDYDNYKCWAGEGRSEDIKTEILASYREVIKNFVFDTNPRKRITFRGDIFKSIGILADNWDDKINIIRELKKAGEKGTYRKFMLEMRRIEGLGSGKKKMMIKIPLILRELRCQGFYSNIPGELCCVPDERVTNVCIGDDGPLYYKPESIIKFNSITSKDENVIDKLCEASAKIYEMFGDWYDIPLFAYADLSKEERDELNREIKKELSK